MMFTVCSGLTSEVSDRRREGRRSAQGTAEWPPGDDRRSGAVVRSTDFVGHLHQGLKPTSVHRGSAQSSDAQ
jgi:hypothetical protein